MSRGTLLLVGSLLLACATVLACATGLAGCAGRTGGDSGSGAPSAPPRTPLRTFAYDCEGTLLIAHFEKPREVHLFLPNRVVRLPQAPSPSGVRFSDGDLGFWAKDHSEAVLERKGQEPQQCREDRRRSLRADAKLRGVQYRGVGNEPGWLLEIGPGSIVFEADYGERRDAFPLTDPRVDASKRRTTYTTNRGWIRLTVSIEATPCRDVMSGEPFETSVEVVLDDVTYRGCGDVLR